MVACDEDVQAFGIKRFPGGEGGVLRVTVVKPVNQNLSRGFMKMNVKVLDGKNDEKRIELMAVPVQLLSKLLGGRFRFRQW